MSSSIGFPPIPNSITGTVILDQNVIDNDAPIPFSKFQTIVGYYSNDIKEYYTDYIRKWNDVKKTSNILKNEEILERYKNFVKEISINYNTIEEKQFFEKMNFDDEKQLEMAIPFFTEKIKSIANYYKNKREDLKFQTTKNKSVGVEVDLQNKIKEFTINFIENLPESYIKYDIDTIKESVIVEVSELFDSYSLYFDQTPDTQIYDYKDLDYGLNIFLKDDETLINEVFGSVSDELKGLKEVSLLFESKRNETRQNISSNFYYISTGNTSTQYVSGLLFDNTNDVGNFFNKKYPTTASTPKGIYSTSKNKGFFKPQKSGILILDGERKNFKIDTEKLLPNSLYYFADPMISGNEQFLAFILDENGLSKNQTSGKARSEPLLTQNDTTFHGYVSEKNLSIDAKYLQEIFDKGYIKDLKKDIFGNVYGLFSNDNNFKNGITIESENTVKSLQLNGHLFYDNVYDEGFSFNYSLYDNIPNGYTIRSGLSSNTGNFSQLSGYYNFFGRYFNPYDELYDPSSDEKTYTYYDGGFLGGVLEPTSSDLSAFPGINVYYYDLLLEGGVNSASPLQRALLDPLFPALTARLTVDFIPDEVNTFDIDCGNLSDTFITDYSFKSPDYYFDNTVLCDSEFVIESFETSSYIERQNLNGVLFVKNIFSNEVLPISAGIPYLSSILSTNVLNSITNNTVRFEIIEDVCVIETDEYFVSFKIGYDGFVYENPKQSPLIITINNNPFNRVSERYYVDGKLFYNLFNTTYPLSSKNLELNFKHYSLDIKSFNLKILGSEDLILSGGNIQYDKMDFPIVAYNDTYKIFNVSTLLKDQNYMFDVLDISFETSPYKLRETKLHKNSSDSFSNIHLSEVTMLSATSITTQNPYLIVL